MSWLEYWGVISGSIVLLFIGWVICYEVCNWICSVNVARRKVIHLDKYSDEQFLRIGKALHDLQCTVSALSTKRRHK